MSANVALVTFGFRYHNIIATEKGVCEILLVTKQSSIKFCRSR